MNTLPFYKSKTVGFNVLMTLIGVAAVLQGTFPKYGEVLGLVTTVGNLILRIWFTSQPITEPTTPPSAS